MRHNLIRRFTTDNHKLRRKDADGEDPEERSVPIDRPAAAVGNLGLTHCSTRKNSVQLLGKKILGSLNQ